MNRLPDRFSTSAIRSTTGGARRKAARPTQPASVERSMDRPGGAMTRARRYNGRCPEHVGTGTWAIVAPAGRPPPIKAGGAFFCTTPARPSGQA